MTQPQVFRCYRPPLMHPRSGKCMPKTVQKSHMFPGACFVKMYYFALDFAIEMPYPLAPPQGWEGSLIFENLAVSHQHSAFSQSNPT